MDALGPEQEVLPQRFITKAELDSCISDIGSQIELHLSRNERGTEKMVSLLSANLEKKLSNIPSKGNMFAAWISSAALILALLALLQMWFSSGYDASNKKAALQDSIDSNQAVIAEILEIQKRNEERTELDSKNLKILIGDHDHKLEFEGQKDE